MAHHRPNPLPARSQSGTPDSHDSTLQSGLLHAQAELDTTNEDNSNLCRENVVLKAQVNALPRAPGNSSVPFSGPLTVDSKKELQNAANQWTYFEDPWVSQAVFGQARPDPSDILPTNKRYEDEVALLAYLTEMIYLYVPVKFHNLIEDFEGFGSDFVRQVKAQRSVAVFKLHSIASTIFAEHSDIQPDVWSSPENRANSDICCRLYLTEDEESSELVFNAPLVPVIYAQNEVSIDGIFQNEALFLIGVCTLYRLTAARDGKFTKNSLGYKWRRNLVTPGFIAWTCIAAIYLLSHGFPFEEVGKKTGIDYSITFNEYKQRIETHQNSVLFQGILAKWNQCLKLGVESTVQLVEGHDSAPKGHAKVDACAASIDAALSEVTANLSISSTQAPQVSEPSASTSTSQGPLSLSSASRIGQQTISTGQLISIPSSSTNPAQSTLSTRRDAIFTIPVPTPTGIVSFNQGDDEQDESDDQLNSQLNQTSHTPETLQPVQPSDWPHLQPAPTPVTPDTTNGLVVSNDVTNKATQQRGSKGAQPTKGKGAVPLRRSNRK